MTNEDRNEKESMKDSAGNYLFPGDLVCFCGSKGSALKFGVVVNITQDKSRIRVGCKDTGHIAWVESGTFGWTGELWENCLGPVRPHRHYFRLLKVTIEQCPLQYRDVLYERQAKLLLRSKQSKNEQATKNE